MATLFLRSEHVVPGAFAEGAERLHSTSPVSTPVWYQQTGLFAATFSVSGRRRTFSREQPESVQQFPASSPTELLHHTKPL